MVASVLCPYPLWSVGRVETTQSYAMFCGKVINSQPARREVLSICLTDWWWGSDSSNALSKTPVSMT
jgi:hypothetical protein